MNRHGTGFYGPINIETGAQPYWSLDGSNLKPQEIALHTRKDLMITTKCSVVEPAADGWGPVECSSQ